MQKIIDKILFPHTTLSRIFPPDTDLKAVKSEIRAAVKRALNGVTPVEHPRLINVCGLPASGKSAVCKAIKAEHPELLYISFDALMEELPVYLAEHLKNRQASFERWEIPARFTGYQLLKQAVRHKLPILFEHSNANPHHVDLYLEIRRIGYTIDIRYIDAAPDLVLPRLASRERFFSPERTRERAALLSKILPDLQKSADDFTVLPPWKEDFRP